MYAEFAVTATLPTELLGVLLAGVSNLVPNGFGPHPNVMGNAERVVALGNAACWHKHPRGIVHTGHPRAANPAEPGFPFRAWLLPHGDLLLADLLLADLLLADLLLATQPAELLVRNDKDGDAVAPRGSATYRAMADDDGRQFRVDLKLNAATIALASGHPNSSALTARRQRHRPWQLFADAATESSIAKAR